MGSRYSYLWMGLAKENGWHVCLNANALGAKDMETLGLSLFQPDFLICSSYKVFEKNPSGFRCLFIKKSTSLVLKNANTNAGLVNIVEASNRPLYLQALGSILSYHHHQYRIKKHLKYMKLVTEKMNYRFLTSNQEKKKGAVVGI
ncbi:hypothetical protein HanXRQr2_Chr15g0714501 [Helianthus annuus]|uniref:Putative pyridoxal phosphate-dependent transferase, major region, subdomain 1 n=1 Tax=Helianthus annuus TaxID=4232 RepID=A0A251SBD3_HELAN|nr:hypothetical protein HanXRQr2_Chr15g0714501 [Helianthus annuus]KAJ0457760.1 hypothetical protein HanIR_Chr15g0777381 [Helianthus annuus]KAJ0833041.1 hypothetical protein HanPSC8_Chr15g0685681 [Helianthus annuus]